MKLLKKLKHKDDMIEAFPLVTVYSELTKPTEENLKDEVYPFTVQIGMGERIEQKYSELFGDEWEVCKRILQEDIVNSLSAFVSNMGYLSESVVYEQKENQK